MSRPAPLIERVLSPFQTFMQAETSGGILLLGCTVVALAWANSPWGTGYDSLWHLPLTLEVPRFSHAAPLHEWINDGLMAIFFFVVGLEIKREFLVGELSSARQAALPIAAAFGGMLVPAALYVALNTSGPTMSGWGVPMATDIAFALGVLSLLGSRIPPALKVFLAALAIVDDIGAVLVIALFYTARIDRTSLSVAAGVLALLVLCNAVGVRSLLVYGVLGLVLWAAVLESGIHATVAGVALALTVPADARPATGGERRSPLLRAEHALHPVVAFAIMPLFALANAGVHLIGHPAAIARSPVTLGVVLGLALGKPVGITVFSWAATRIGLAELPAGSGWRALHGVAWLGGIGFTMSLFIAALAFGDDAHLAEAKIGILAASAVAGVVGTVVLLRATRPVTARA